jgi:hypothetical protein
MVAKPSNIQYKALSSVTRVDISVGNNKKIYGSKTEVLSL